MPNLPKMAQEAMCVKLGVTLGGRNHCASVTTMPLVLELLISRNTLAEFEILRLHLL